MLRVKRAYDTKEAADGRRILVDRLWPRGLRATAAGVDEWLKDLAPSDELRRWFGHQPERWPEFRQRYREELSAPQKVETLKQIARMAVEGDATLLYAARDSEHNNARVLEELVTDYTKSFGREGGR